MQKFEVKGEELKDAGAWVIKATGSIDVFSYRDLSAFLDAWSKERGEGPKRLVLDLSEALYIGSSGWSVIFLQAADLEKDGGMMVVSGMSERVRRSLDLIMPKKRSLQCTDDLAGALAMLKGSS